MSSFGNTDAVTDKPKWSKERQVESFVNLTTVSTTASGNTVLFFAANAVSNANISTGMYVIGPNVGFSGEPGFFSSNVTVSSVTSNTVTLSSNTTGIVPSGSQIGFDTTINYNPNTFSATYFSDTVLVTPTRLANSSFANTATPHTGWVHVETGTGGRAGRVQVEVLAVLSNAVASNASSGMTSNTGTYYSGL